MLNYLEFTINYVFQNLFKKRIRPRVLQMPITNRCNSRCITCNIWKENQGRIDIDAKELKKALCDPFFSKVKMVGINGGEPSLYKNIDDLLEALFTLKKLRRIHVISNAIITDKLTEMMEIIKKRCIPRGIKVYLTISIDGVGAVHNQIRGIPGAYDKTISTLLTIKSDLYKYCDVMDAGCTISNNNIAYLVETEEYLKSLGIDVYFHPAVPNNRLHNFYDQDFSIMSNERSTMLAMEYFFGKFKYGKGLKIRLRSFLIYYQLKNGGNKRIAGCNYLRSDVTISENLDLSLCATASHIIGNLKIKTAKELLADGALSEMEYMVRKNCESCMHYIVFPSLKGALLFLKELLKPSVWIKYKLMATWLK